MSHFGDTQALLQALQTTIRDDSIGIFTVSLKLTNPHGVTARTLLVRQRSGLWCVSLVLDENHVIRAHDSLLETAWKACFNSFNNFKFCDSCGNVTDGLVLWSVVRDQQCYSICLTCWISQHYYAHYHSSWQDECSICRQLLSKFKFVTTSCGHNFHDECLGKHIETSSSSSRGILCPLCRRRFETVDEAISLPRKVFASKILLEKQISLFRRTFLANENDVEESS